MFVKRSQTHSICNTTYELGEAHINCVYGFKVCGCYLVWFSWSLTSTSSIYTTKVMLHYQNLQ